VKTAPFEMIAGSFEHCAKLGCARPATRGSGTREQVGFDSRLDLPRQD
jgi:hypothetical protein